MKFIHYGCWNNIDCGKDARMNVRDIVIDYIKAYEDDYEFLIVSGDNWYSNKKDMYKYYFTNVLRSGFIKLYDLNKTCHIILGNHDEDVVSNKPLTELQKNCMLNTEKYYIQKINDENDAEYLAPYLSYLYGNISEYWTPKEDARLYLHEAREYPEVLFMEEYNMVFIFINTNIFYQNNNTDDIKSYIQQIEDGMLTYPKASQYFIVGHVPITSKIPMKNDTDISSLSDDSDITSYFIETLSPYNPIYLCADTHNFQISTINKQLLQVVVGTGGASADILDDENDIINYTYTADDISYDIEGFHKNAYGYSVIEINDDKTINITYKRLVHTSKETNLVNKAYVYQVAKKNGEFNISRPYVSKLNDTIDFNAAMHAQRDICNNLTEEHLVKEKIGDSIQYCYQKSK